MTYDFQERLAYSKGARCASDAETIKALLDGCETVIEHNTQGDDKGIDYIARLRRGALVYIDAKTREKGCSKYWRGECPELAIETWSVMPGGKYNTPAARAKAGWTIDESKLTDMILYTFDKSDCTTAYLLPFQSLRMAARRMLKEWTQRFKVDVQTSGGWQSQAVFVPADLVIDAIQCTFIGALRVTETETFTLQAD